MPEKLYQLINEQLERSCQTLVWDKHRPIQKSLDSHNVRLPRLWRKDLLQSRLRTVQVKHYTKHTKLISQK
ncbi:MAG: hypothetical protein GXO43_07915 [Crenarchaeota archaeon]|nr:hypothetical protein [Thermoproteota archaeon]